MTRNRLLTLLLCVIILAAIYISLWVSHLPMESLWVVEGEEENFTLATDDLEKLSEKIPVSFQSQSKGLVEALGSATAMKVIDTNSDLAYILPYPILSGAFVLEENWVVLNKKAAHQLFYSEKIEGETLKLEGKNMKIVGVVEDGDKEAAVYSLSPKGTVTVSQLLFFSTKEQPLTRGELAGYLQALGIEGVSYRQISLGKTQKVVKNLPFIFPLILAIYLTVMMLKKQVKVAKGYKEKWQKAERNFSFEEWIVQGEKPAGKMLVLAIGMMVAGGSGTALLVYFLSQITTYFHSISQVYYFTADNFPIWGKQYRIAIFLQLGLFLAWTILFVVSIYKRKKDSSISLSI